MRDFLVNLFWPITIRVQKYFLYMQGRCGVRCAHKADIHDCPQCRQHARFMCHKPVDGKLAIIPIDQFEALNEFRRKA